jgi:hypothetical protein
VTNVDNARLAQHARARRQWKRLPLTTEGTQLSDEVFMQLMELGRPHFAFTQVGLVNRLDLTLPDSLKGIRLLLRRLEARGCVSEADRSPAGQAAAVDARAKDGRK